MAKRLGELLLEAGLIDEATLDKALERQERQGGRLGSNLVAMQAIDERLVAQALSLQHGLPFVVLSASAIPLAVLDGFSLEIARKHTALPLHADGDDLIVAMSDPQRKIVVDELGFLAGKRIVEHGALRSLLQDVIEEAYRIKDGGKQNFWEGLDLDPQAQYGENGQLEFVVGRAPETQDPSPSQEVDEGGLATMDEDPSWVDELAGGQIKISGTRRLLVVDDEPGIRQMLVAYFTKTGYEVIAAADGQEGIKQLQAQLPDAVVLDAMLPGIHGFDICKRIKSSEATRHIPVVMVSAVYKGWRYADDVREKYGADAFLEKPLRLDELGHVLKKALANAGSAPAPRALSEQAEAALKQAAVMYRSGDLMGAVHHLRQAIEAAPFEASLHSRLGLLYEKLNEPFRAIAALERAVELECQHDYVLALAKLYEKTGFDAKAYESWERCLRMKPDGPEADEIRKRLEKLLP